jgi:drug/metabolite transporter (DMT)-like permease
MPTSTRALSSTAFATLLLIALMMGANHVAARVAFNNGVDVATAVVFRCAVTALVVSALVWLQHVPVALAARHKRFLPVIGLLIGVQSLCLYSSVARLPVALAAVTEQGGFHLPQATPGWWGLAALTFLYGTAFTIMFTVLPKLGVAGNSAIMNVEPVFALVLAWMILNQTIAPIQITGALIVVGTVMVLGLRRK